MTERAAREPVRLLAVADEAAGDDLAVLKDAVGLVMKAHPHVEFVVARDAERTRLLELMQRADILVVARTAAAPRSVPPALPVAMAGGLCVVATAVGGVPGVLTDGLDGLLVPGGDAPALAAALVRVVTDDDTRRRLGMTAALSIRGALRSA